MEFTDIIKKKIVEFYVFEYGKEPTGLQLDVACRKVKSDMVDTVLSGFSWKQYIPMEGVNEDRKRC